MEVRHASLERGLTISFALIILVVIAFLPVTLFAMSGLTTQAQALRDTVIRGQLAYAKVANDADSLRAATLEAA
jgi:Tfp pilus assembly protein PilX